MDVAKLVSFPGELGFALNKKVISTGLLNGGIKGQFNWGELNGRKKDYSFENKYIEACINFQVILNTWINRNFKFEKFRPYAFVGVGVIKYRTILRNGDGNIVSSYGYNNGHGTIYNEGEEPEKGTRMTELIFPIGGGVNYRLNDVLLLELELSTRYINSDKLDAKVAMKDDKYIFFSVGITYLFQEKEFLSNILSK